MISGQYLRIHVETLSNRDWLVWAAVVLDNSLEPPVIHGRLKVGASEEDIRERVRFIVARRYTPAVAQHAHWVGSEQVPVLAHAAMTDMLAKSLRLSLERVNRTRQLPARKRSMREGSARMRTLLRLHGDTCCWCGKTCRLTVVPQHPDRATVEHVIPKSRGGSNMLPNLRVACYACNNARGDKDSPPPSG